MFGIQSYGSFVLAVLVFQLIPGAGTITILNATARHGTRAGMSAVAGTLCADFTFMVSAVAGLAAIMKANPALFQALQWFGAAYLCWMGVQLLRRQIDQDTVEPKQPPAFRQAFTVGLTNPKAVLFFVSFFPLFLKPGASLATLALMMAHVTAISLAYQTALVFVGNSVAARLKALPSARRIATRLSGLALVGLGVKLAANNR
jgi:threonine/homoserine/homoserine lactone efflux protein